MTGPAVGSRQHVALRGEAEAERTLRGAGFAILERRWRDIRGEIDLIADDRGVLVFVEVKTRLAGDPGRPADAVTPRKQRTIARVALGYLACRGWLERDCRFDVVEVIAGPAECRVHHIVDAFRARTG